MTGERRPHGGAAQHASPWERPRSGHEPLAPLWRPWPVIRARAPPVPAPGSGLVLTCLSGQAVVGVGVLDLRCRDVDPYCGCFARRGGVLRSRTRQREGCTTHISPAGVPELSPSPEPG